MKIKIPKEVMFGCLTYKIYLDESQDDAEFSGSALHKKLEIRINPILPDIRKNLALIHEVVHAFTKIYVVDPSDRDVELLANGFSEFLFRNLDIELDWSDIPALKLKEEDVK